MPSAFLPKDFDAKRPVALIAGRGRYPVITAAAIRAAGVPLRLIAMDDETEPSLIASFPETERVTLNVGQVGKMLDLLREHGVSDLIFAGRVKRPSLVGLMPDARGAKFMAKIAGKALGDDGLLRAVVAELEGEGFRVLGPETLLTDLLMPQGLVGKLAPDEAAWTDIRHALKVARGLGALDVGQGAVVQQGLVLGVEAIEGTDALLARCADLKREGPGGVLAKVKKPGQEERVDLPTIGKRTVEAAAKAGLRGIAVEAGQALLLDREGVAAAADKLGLFVIGVGPND